MLTLLAIFFGLFCWFMTSVGSSLVFLSNAENNKWFSILNHFAVGIMLGSVLFGLLSPSLSFSQTGNITTFLPAVGFLIGGIVISSLKLLPEKFDSCFKLSLGITLHNIPEGLCVGIAIGAISIASSSFNLYTAILLAVSIGIQNIPEGFAIAHVVSLNKTKKAGFLFGSLTGLAEPIFCVVGFFLTNCLSGVAPLFLGFAASSMLVVAILEILDNKTTYSCKKTEFLNSLSLIIGFTIIMVFSLF